MHKSLKCMHCGNNLSGTRHTEFLTDNGDEIEICGGCRTIHLLKLESALRMRDLLINRKFITVSLENSSDKTYLRLNTKGVMESFYEDGWTPFALTMDEVVTSVIQGYRSWQPCDETTVEIALITSSTF